jgi:Fur family transcriptional regulator, ferric uptake regulator
MSHYLLNYPEKMRSRGYRVTPQRKAILDAICAAGRRVTVEEITRSVCKKSPHLNRATIYRNLKFLQKIHLVDVTGSGKQRRFEIASLEPHHHMICRRCGAEMDLEPKLIQQMTGAVRRKYGFQIDASHMCFSGLCRSCASGGTSRARSARRTDLAPHPKEDSS